MKRYRIRTWLRGNLPGLLSRAFPKGNRSCRAHEWYDAGGNMSGCYHCKAIRFGDFAVIARKHAPTSCAWTKGAAKLGDK